MLYIDERLAREAAVVTAGPDTYLKARITADGNLHPTDFILNGKALGGR